MASDRIKRQRREERRERRRERERLDQGVSPSRVKLPERAKKSVAKERRDSVEPQWQDARAARAASTYSKTPDYKARVTERVVDNRAIPAQHPLVTAFQPSTVTKTPAPKEKVAKNSSFTKQEHDTRNSPLARDEKFATCKKRPDKLTPRRAGGGAAKKFVPWCK